MKEAEHPNIYFHWQPNQSRSSESAITELKTVLPRLAALHVFKWQLTGNELIRQPLKDGEKEWKEYIKIANSTNRDIDALIEFVKNDSPEQFLQDANALKNSISNSVFQY